MFMSVTPSSHMPRGATLKNAKYLKISNGKGEQKDAMVGAFGGEALFSA